MASKLTNNQILINEIVKQDFNDNKDYEKEDDFFEFFCATQVLKNYDLSYEEIEQGIIGAGLDGGCDGIYLFLNGALIKEDNDEIQKYPKDIKLELIILQSKNNTSFKEDAILKWKNISGNLLEMSNRSSDFKGRYNEDVLRSFDLFKDIYIKLIRKKIKLNISYLYISKGMEIHPNVLAQAKELEEEIKSLYPNPNVTVAVQFIGADRLMELASTLNYNNYNLKLMEAPIAIGSRKDYVALVNIQEYFNFITNEKKELIKNIFESNVRDYQGNTAVNGEIQETLQNGVLEDFWWLNNGITILASEAMLATGREIVIEDPEIVNGLQTSTEIYNYFSNHPDKVQEEKRGVLVRIIVPESEESRDRIILATNSQTTIPKSSLRATDIIHRQIELYIKSRGLYYDRRKNYYKNQGKKSSEIVSVSFLAQCLMSIILQKPDYARARPSTLLTNDESYKLLYIKNQNLNSFYNAAYIGKKVENVLKKMTIYTTVEKGDILFYVIFALVAEIVANVLIGPNDLASIDVENIQLSQIESLSEEVYSIYKGLGGTSKIAKSSELISRLKEYLNRKIKTAYVAAD